MVRKLLALFIIATFTLSAAHADVLFEGYYKVLSGEQQIGYVVTRYEFDAKKKQFLSTYFLKTGKGTSEITESVKAAADSELAPISYEPCGQGIKNHRCAVQSRRHDCVGKTRRQGSKN